MRPLILLAGGRSSRMGEPKGLIDFRGQTWIDYQLEKFEKAGGTLATVVLGFDSEKYFEKIPNLKQASHNSIQFKNLILSCVINPNPECGQFSSLQTGINKIEISNGAFVLPIDVPAPNASTWKILNAALVPPIQIVIPEYNQHGGHPICLNSDLLKYLSALSPQSGRLDEIVHELPKKKVVRIPVTDSRVEMNFNVQKDWTHFKETFEST